MRVDAPADVGPAPSVRPLRAPPTCPAERVSCEDRPMRTDPSETGGLFVGRRPGTAPVRFRALPKRGSDLRRRFDGSLAGILLAAMMLLCLLCWGPIPLACLWLGSQARLPVGQRQPRHPRLVRRAVRAAVRRARDPAPAGPGMDPRAPRRRPRPAHGSARARVRDHRGRVRRLFVFWFVVIHGPGPGRCEHA